VTLDDVLAAAGPLSAPSDIAENGAHHGYRRAVVVNGGARYIPAIADMLTEFTPIRECWVSWIDPGGYILEHVDGGPYLERWQIPLTDAGVLIQDGEPVAHEVGVPFRVHQDRWHSVRNDSDLPRVSLVIDRDIPSGAPSAPFRLKEHAWPTSKMAN
jgi:hypothetical protein